MAAERYVLDEMPEIERYRFEEHFFECTDCAETMRLWQDMRVHAKDLFGDAPAMTAPVEATVASAPRRFSLHLVMPYAAAAVLAVALVQQTWLSNDGVTSGQAVTPVMLRAATRGELPVVTLPEGDALVALSVDIDAGAPGDPVSYAIAGEDGSQILKNASVVPPTGTSFLIVFSADRLRNGRQFVLTLTTASATREYRFTTAGR
jgi:hypothetical protein